MTTFQDYILQVITLKQVILNLALKLIQRAALAQSFLALLQDFTIKRIQNAIAKLKAGKSPGVDMILNEMLKSSQDYGGPQLSQQQQITHSTNEDIHSNKK